jgi:hypothetical protein
MTSERQRQANRANAQASSGPKTARGKARSAQNAFRHGLSVPVYSDPALAQKVEVWAQRIAGAGADAAILAPARRVAEAQIDLQRVRACRHRRIEQALADPDYEAAKVKARKLAPSIRWLSAAWGIRPTYVSEADIALITAEPPRGPDKLATILCELARELPALDRYERRARWRRKRAIREFDQARDAAARKERALTRIGC